jgi:hypothetical protein
VNHQCGGEGIGQIRIERATGGSTVFAATLRPGHKARQEVSIDSEADIDYLKAFTGPFDPNESYVARQQLDAVGRQIFFADPSFRPSSLHPGDVVTAGRADASSDTKSLAEFYGSRLRC